MRLEFKMAAKPARTVTIEPSTKVIKNKLSNGFRRVGGWFNRGANRLAN